MFARVENYVHYIERKNAETGGDAKIIYSIGYERLYALPSDVFLCAALMLLCVGSFAVEYRSQSSMGGFSQILRAAKHGRMRTFVCKLLTFGALGTGISVLFRAVTLWIVSRNYVLPDLDAALYSVQAFCDVCSDITIGQYLLLDLCLQVVLGVLVSVIACAVSCLCRRPLATISMGLLAIGLPEVLAGTVLPQLAACSPLSFSSPLPVTSLSAQKRLFGGDFPYLLCALALLALLCTALTLLAGRKFCKSQYHGGK